MPEKLGGVLPQQQPQHQGRKRKQSPTMPELSSVPSSSQGYQQTTLRDHFSPASNVTCAAAVPPKRSKGNSPELQPNESKSAGAPTIATTIPALGSHGSNPIDLTKSPISKGKETAKPAINNRPPPFQTHSGARKIPIKNLRKSTRSNPEAYFNTTWVNLDKALTSIFNGERITMSKEELYRSVENCCRTDRSPQLFANLHNRLEAYVNERLKVKASENLSSDDTEAARVIEVAWSEWGKQLISIRSIFLYLDRSYLYPSPNHQCIEPTGVTLFRKYIASDRALESRLLNGTFALFKQDRDNRGEETVNQPLLISCVRMLRSLNLYWSAFEPKFVEESRKYFAQLARREESQELKGYLRECASQLDMETRRADRYDLNPQTKRQLIRVAETEMIKNKADFLTDVGNIRELLEKVDYGALAALYDLLGRVGNAGEGLKPAWEAYICKEGSKIITDIDRLTEMVPRLLNLKGTLDTLLAGPFQKSDVLVYTLRESFQKFINERRTIHTSANNSKPAEMIAKYVDMLLRSGTKGLAPVYGVTGASEVKDDDDALGNRLELVLDLFRFIQGKDVFEAFYKKDLARRLLMGRSASVDAERLMLTKLKTECGAGFTHNLEGMFKDMDLSKESVTSFKASKTSLDKSHGVDLHVNILSASAWPTYPEIPVQVPPQLMEHLNAFAEFYVSKHKGRKLAWRHSLSHCVLKASFPKGQKELLLSAFQALVLLMFNHVGEKGVLSYKDLLSATGLPEPELKRTLQSMACGKIRVLLKSPKGRDVDDLDKFQVNNAFTDPKFRVKINQIQLKETKEENKETHERVAQDRQYETQAAIIRIMKSRKKVKHVELIRATIEQTKNRGMLDVGDIKKNIEKLIDKDYMDREDDEYYVYLA